MKTSDYIRAYNKYYKHLLILPAILLVFSLSYMFYFYSVNDDFIYKDVSLTGGTTVTIDGNINIPELRGAIENKLEDLTIRQISDLVTRQETAIIIETKSGPEETRQVLEDFLGYPLTSENSSFEFTGSTISQNFYKQLVIAIILAFLFMAIVVFVLFRTFIPSMAVIISAFADILMTLVVVNLLEMKLSTAGIVAFLMLIGYSVDTDILLTTRVLKRKSDSINRRIFGAFKTGMMMILTSIIALTFALIITSSFSNTLSQIFTILLIGLVFDVFNTWITNASIIKWYAEKQNEI